MFLTLSNPINSHTVTVPFGDGTMTWKIYITAGEQKLISVTEDGNEWEHAISVEFVAQKSQWLASGRLRGID